MDIEHTKITSQSPRNLSDSEKALTLTFPPKHATKEFFKTPDRKSILTSTHAQTDFIPYKGSIPIPSQCLSVSPQRELVSDRFIPIRSDSVSRNLFGVSDTLLLSPEKIEPFKEDSHNKLKYNSLLENQLLDLKHPHLFSKFLKSPANKPNPPISIISTPDKKKEEPPVLKDCMPKLLKFRNPIKENKDLDMQKYTPFPTIDDDEKSYIDSLKPYRNINKIPYKILDAPGLIDDFYLNLMHWSEKKILAVSLLNILWLWDAETGKVLRFCEKLTEERYTSVQWDPNGTILALGDTEGNTEIWDYLTQKRIKVYEGHEDRVDCISWNNSNLLSTGSRDNTIKHRDLRTNRDSVMKLDAHKDEVCGLKWSPNGQQLASGANDNKVIIWSLKKNEPEFKFGQHQSAVKAMCWSPHQQGLLLSGGGYSDKSIKVWNTLSYSLVNEVETESQVCNIVFSRNSNEFVSTHGLNGNQIIVWKYPDLTKLTVIEGEQSHSERVLYLTDSPDGEDIATGASDETIKFWKVFPGKPNKRQSYLFPSFTDLR